MTDQAPASPAAMPRQPEDESISAPAPAAPPTEEKKRKFKPRAAILTVVLATVAVLLVLFAWRLPPFSSSMEQTENAFIRGQVTVISPQVNGYIVEVLAGDFQSVEAGARLFRIDDRTYRQRLEQAKANQAGAEAQLANSTQTGASRKATVGAREAELASARAQLQRAQADMARVADLAADGSVSLRERDQAAAALQSA